MSFFASLASAGVSALSGGEQAAAVPSNSYLTGGSGVFGDVILGSPGASASGRNTATAEEPSLARGVAVQVLGLVIGAAILYYFRKK